MFSLNKLMHFDAKLIHLENGNFDQLYLINIHFDLYKQNNCPQYMLDV